MTRFTIGISRVGSKNMLLNVLVPFSPVVLWPLFCFKTSRSLPCYFSSRDISWPQACFIAIAFEGAPWVLSIMPNWPVRGQWNTQGKCNSIFRWSGPTDMNGSLIPNSLIKAKNQFVKNGTANFSRNIPTWISGPPPEVIQNIPVGRNRLFHLNSHRNFRNLCHNGKHALFPSVEIRLLPVRDRNSNP